MTGDNTLVSSQSNKRQPAVKACMLSGPIIFLHRRLDGISNNKDHVLWGAAQEDVARDAPAMYADGIALPAGACTPEQRKTGNCRYVNAINGIGSNRPSARKISNELFQQVGTH